MYHWIKKEEINLNPCKYHVPNIHKILSTQRSLKSTKKFTFTK